MARRILMGATLAVVAAGLLWLDARLAPGTVALTVAIVLSFLAQLELARMGSLAAQALGLPLRCAWIACSVQSYQRLSDGAPPEPFRELGLLYAATLLGLLVGTLGAWLASRAGPRPRPSGQVLGLGLWLLPPIFLLVPIERTFGTLGLVLLVVLAKIGDNAGYFVGKAIGKRRPFPGISPGKTVAGCVASLVAGTLAGAVLLPLTLGEPGTGGGLLGALVGAAINLAAQASDLSESWVKRRAGVKDSSTWLGPSGGVLDVIDSLFLAAPVALVLWALLYPSAIS